MKGLKLRPSDTRQILFETLSKYHRSDYLPTDPLLFVHEAPGGFAEKEAAALFSAVLSYGSVKQIQGSIRDFLNRIQGQSGSLEAWVRKGAGKRLGSLQGWSHRFNRGDDLWVLGRLLSESWARYGSLGAHFVEGLAREEATVEQATDRLIEEWKTMARSLSAADSFFYLLTAPKDGSCCKRWMMLLRWMGRRDEVDPGLWTWGSSEVEKWNGRVLLPHQLVVPLDTHTGRIAQALGLTQRKSLNWKAAIEVTQALKKFDANDPVKFDFALCRAGMLKTW